MRQHRHGRTKDLKALAKGRGAVGSLDSAEDPGGPK